MVTQEKIDYYIEREKKHSEEWELFLKLALKASVTIGVIWAISSAVDVLDKGSRPAIINTKGKIIASDNLTHK